MASDWLVGADRREAAAERIYAVAADLIARRGLDGFDIDSLARHAHCSRATLYRHVGGKARIQDEVLTRAARRIVDTVRRSVAKLQGSDRVGEAIIVAVREIRRDPVASHVFAAGRPGNVAGFADAGALVGFAADLTGIDPHDSAAGQWITRVVLSLMVWPPGDTATEEDMVRRFVAPAFTDASASMPDA